MSSRTYISYGYGFREEDFMPTLSGIKKLLSMAPNTQLEYQSEIDELESFDDVRCLSDMKNWGSSLYGVFISAISELEDVFLTSAWDDDLGYCLMFIEQMPWRLNETEKQLTEEKLKELFVKYLHIYCEIDVWSNEKLSDIGDIQAETYG